MMRFIRMMLFCACIAQAMAVSGQSIRKDYREMTAAEKSISGAMPDNVAPRTGKNVKVWQAVNGKVILDQYTCSDTEAYFYTGVIEAGYSGEFVVPSGANVKIVSGGLQTAAGLDVGYIRLTPGFHAERGAEFNAKIDDLYFTDPVHASVLSPGLPQSIASDDLIRVYPNPSSGGFAIELPADLNEAFSYSITNAFGSIVKSGDSSELITNINTTGITQGIHILKITTASGVDIAKRIVIN